MDVSKEETIKQIGTLIEGIMKSLKVIKENGDIEKALIEQKEEAEATMTAEERSVASELMNILKDLVQSKPDISVVVLSSKDDEPIPDPKPSLEYEDDEMDWENPILCYNEDIAANRRMHHMGLHESIRKHLKKKRYKKADICINELISRIVKEQLNSPYFFDRIVNEVMQRMDNRFYESSEKTTECCGNCCSVKEPENLLVEK